MQPVKTDTFFVAIPDIFESVRVMWQSVRAEHAVDDDAVTLLIGPSDDTMLKKQRTLATDADRFRAFCLSRRGPAELIDEQTFAVDGRTVHVVTVRAETGYAFYFAMVSAADGFHYELSGDCPVGREAEYFPLFAQALHSLRGFGDMAAALAAQQQAIGALGGPRASSAPAPTPIPATPRFVVPEDGQEILRIGGQDFTYLPETTVDISQPLETGSELVIDLKARLVEVDDPARQSLFLNDYEDGQIYLRFSVKGIYRAGVPTGRFTFENDRDTAGIAYLWKGGFEYSMNLVGELVLEAGWVGFSGYFQGSDEATRHPVALARRLPLETLDWTNYRFTSFDELFTAPVDVPRHLQVIKLGMAALPERLYDYTALKSLNIACQAAAGAPHALREIPAEITRLKHLEWLAFTSIGAVEEIPAALGELHGLRWLYITASQAASVPDAVMALPALTNCVLSHNRLASLPEHITASLTSLSVDDNRLTELPQVLATLPNLEYLNLNRNPLVSLPAGVDRIENLNLELEKKFALLDYTYRGADGQGTVPFDDAPFLAAGDPVLDSALDEALEDEAWVPYRDTLRGLALRSVALATTEPDDYGTVGNHRIGGLPDLPADMAYPTFTNHEGARKGYLFIAQLNCADLAPHQDYLPRSGLLYFFITGQESIRGLVLHVDDTAGLQSASALSLDDDFFDDDDGLYLPYRVDAAAWISVPPFYSTASYALGGGALDGLEEETDLTEALTDDVRDAAPVEPVHAVNSYVFKQHDTPQIEAADKLKGRPEDFVVLLRVSSDSNPGFNFWDAGEIYFVIHKSDLARGDFSNVYCGLESS